MIAEGGGGTSSRPRDSQVSGPRRPSNQENNLRQLMEAYQGYRERSEASQSSDQIRVYSQQLLPLIKALSEENNRLKQQKAIITQQFKRLDFVTDTLTKQNQDMQKHCARRALDLEKVIQTISINLNEEENDINHRIHLLREQNNIIIKNLNEILKQQGSVEDQIHRDEQLKLSLTNSQKEDQMKILEHQSKIEAMEEEINQLEAKRKKILDDYEEANEQVNRFCINNMELRNKNIEKIYELKDFEQEINKKKPVLQRDNLRLHSDLLLLRKEASQAQKQLSDKSSKNDKLQTQSRKIKSEIVAKQTQVDTNVLSLADFRQQSQQSELLLNQSKQRQMKCSNELQGQLRKLQESSRQLKTAQADSDQQRRSFLEQIRQKKQSYASAIRNLQSTLSKRSAAYSQQKTSLEFTIKQLKLSIESTKQDIKEQDIDLAQLQKQLTGYTQSNKQLERMSYQLRQADQELEESRRRQAGASGLH